MKRLKVAPVLIAVALTTAGCQGGGSKAADATSPSEAASGSCDKSLSAPVQAAMKRVADLPVSAKTSFIGDRQRAAEQVVARYEAFKECRMGKTALAGVKVGGTSGASVLIRGDVRSRSEASESAAATREDNLHILHGTSRTLASLLNCKENSGLSDTFRMPSEACEATGRGLDRRR